MRREHLSLVSPREPRRVSDAGRGSFSGFPASDTHASGSAVTDPSRDPVLEIVVQALDKAEKRLDSRWERLRRTLG
jgi:hypothetical protein